MTAIENIIREIESEVRQHGNTKARIGAVLRLLKNKIVDLFSSVGGKLDKGGYTGTALDLNSAILQRVVKESGKGLSTNDFTQQYKQLLDELKDYDIDLDEHTTELMLKKGEVVVKRIGLAFLNDEGTKLFYNEQKKQLELKNDEGRVLSEIPISHLVANMPTGIVVQNGKIRLMAGSKVIEENVISYNNLADKPELNFIPTDWNKRNGKEIIKTQTDDWLRINEEGSHPNGVYFGGSTIRTDKGIQVGEGGKKFLADEENGSIVLADKVRILARPNNNHVAFGNKAFDDLIVGEFKGIQIWGHENEEKVVLSNGGVKDLSLVVPTYKNITDAHTFLDKDQAIVYGSGSGIVNAPSGNYYSMLGVTHSSKNWGFIIAKNIDEDDHSLYVKQVISGSYKDWFKLQGSSDNISIWNYIEVNHFHNNTTIFVEKDVNIQLKGLISLDCVSFRKVYAGGNAVFSCDGKQIIYTGDNQFNGGDGSTAVASIWNNKCYIDIRNV